MNAGTKVYRAYISLNHELSWIDEGIVTDVVLDGVALVRVGSLLSPLTDKWRPSQVDAKRDAHAALIRHIGSLQAKADEMRDEILHEHLLATETAA